VVILCKSSGVRLTLVRHATLRVEFAGLTLLVDPQLDPKGAHDGVPGTADPRPSPLVDLPLPAADTIAGVDAVLVTHLHGDHFDATARELLPREPPLLCQPEDAERLRGDGFTDVRPVEDVLTLGGLRVYRTGGQHGTGEIGAKMAPVCGFVLAAAAEPVVYVAGDTIFCPEVRDAVATHAPATIVVNAGAARFLEGDPITMTADDVIALARHAPAARIVAVHFETVSHCTETRADLRGRVREEELEDRIAVPEDGESV
jgi:L-ascorbate metabolism protein UlaG (beta-lactamase superfamily)